MSQTAWLVERRDQHYLYVPPMGLLDWTADPNKALRLARREDADALAGLCDGDDCEAVEHMWMDGPVQAAMKDL